MKKDPETPLLVGRGFLVTANAVIDCRMAKIAVGEGITRSIFDVKEVDLGEEEAPYWTTLGKMKSYKPRPSSNGVDAQISYNTRKDFLDLGEGITRSIFDVKEVDLGEEEAPYWTMLGKRKSYKPRPSSNGVGAQISYNTRKDFELIPINLKSNMWDSDELINNPINWTKPPKNKDGTWHANIRLIDPDGEEFTKTLQSIPATRKLSKRESPREIINLDHFYDT
nr:hypothetical protein [Tanacetum cinerariifolium]